MEQSSENITPNNSDPLASSITSQNLQPVLYANFFERAAALFLDFLLFIPPVIFLVFLKAFLYSINSELNVNILFVFLPLIFPFYGIILLLRFNSTLGKKLLKLKVVSSTNSSLDIIQIILRETIGKIVSGSIFWLGYLWPLFDPKKQAWHDKIFNTYVIKDPSITSRKKYVFAYISVFILYFIVVFLFFILFFKSIYSDKYPCGTKIYDIEYTNLSSALTNKDKVCFLNLSSQNLSSLPDGVYELKNLKMLKITNNQISSISGQIGSLRKLTHLYLSNNQLTSLPPEVAQLTELKELEISVNKFTHYPPYLDQLKNLEYVGLENNPFAPGEKDKIIKNHPRLRMNLYNVPD